MYMRLILLGCPGAGKGTQAKLISEKYHIPKISTGDILRTAIQEGTALGKEVKGLVEGGKLVPDDMITQLVLERISEPDCKDGFLLDGYPRNVKQADALHQRVAIDFVIDIDVPEEEIVGRLGGRRIHPTSGRTYHVLYQPPKHPDKDDITGEPLIQRADDLPQTVRKRLAVYQAETSPLRDYYLHFRGHPGVTKPQYVKIKGNGPVDEIKTQIFTILNKSKEYQ
jgi:adenylate kinase